MKRQEILEVLKKSKEIFLKDRSNGLNLGMCVYIYKELNRYKYFVNSIRELELFIPKYNPEYLKSYQLANGYWWPVSDTESRIKAFDKLIAYYSKPTLKEKIIELCKKVIIKIKNVLC